MHLRLALGLGLAVASVAGMGYGVASAQYPQPVGLCTVTPASANVPTNGTASFTVQTSQANGTAAPGVPGTVSIAKQPGNGASAVTPTYTTNDQGTALISITTGDTAGTVNVAVTAGTLSCASAISVTAPQVSSNVIKPPDTGTGGTSSGGMNVELLVLAGLGVAAAGAASLVVARRRG
jgi:hypothetical protein